MATKNQSLLEGDAWLRSLRGAESFISGPNEHGGYAEGFEGVSETTEFPGGTWRTSVILPVDLNLADEWADPLLPLALLAFSAQRIDDKLEELARFCRSRGKTWTEIGRALGVSKQSAWERFSGED